jgi:hypothetical protein
MWILHNTNQRVLTTQLRHSGRDSEKHFQLTLRGSKPDISVRLTILAATLFMKSVEAEMSGERESVLILAVVNRTALRERLVVSDNI